MRFFPDVLVTQLLFDFRKQLHLLVVMMTFDEPEPSQSVSNERRLIGVFDMWRLQVNGVVASQYSIMDMSHMRCTSCKDVILLSQLHGPCGIWRCEHTFFVAYCGVVIKAHG
jgi:hypothetical protein